MLSHSYRVELTLPGYTSHTSTSIYSTGAKYRHG